LLFPLKFFPAHKGKKKQKIKNMIKKKLTYAALALLTLGFIGCQQEDDFAPQGQEIRVAFTTDAIQTRMNTLGTGDVWDNGDQVKIERTIKYNSDYYTYTVSVVENGTPIWTLDKKLFWNGEEEHILAAFYPAVGQDDYRSFELPEDQSTLEKLKSADCMNAVWVGKPTTDPINFQIKHRLSMITIDYDFASEFTNATIDYAQVIPSDPFVMFDAKDGGKMDEPYGVFGTTIDAYHDAVNKTIQAIVIPCTYPEGQLFMKISVNGEELQVKMPEAKTFDEGTHYTFDLKVGKDKVTLTPTTTDTDFPGGWNNEEDLN
jgi:hypothetical protein